MRRAAGGRDYDGSLGLSLVVGPAHAGKVALLLDFLQRYLNGSKAERRKVAGAA